MVVQYRKDTYCGLLRELTFQIDVVAQNARNHVCVHQRTVKSPPCVLHADICRQHMHAVRFAH